MVRQKRILVLAVVLALAAERVYAFVLPCRRWCKQISEFGRAKDAVRCYSSSFLSDSSSSANDRNPDGKEAITRDNNVSNFWYSVPSSSNEEALKNRVPFVPSLDSDGPLPDGAYPILSHASLADTSWSLRYPSKPTCLLSIALNIDNLRDDEIKTEELVDVVHSYIDSGFTTFHLQSSSSSVKYGLETVFRGLQESTPSSVMDRVHLVVPWRVPSIAQFSKTRIRQSVLESLHAMKGDCIDTLQVGCLGGNENEDMYVLESLEHLMDLQREGLIRSIAGRNLSPSLLQKVSSCDFRLDSHQQDGNLLCPDFENKPFKSMNQLVSSPLAGGLLTNRYLDTPAASSALWNIKQHVLPYQYKMLEDWCLSNDEGRIPLRKVSVSYRDLLSELQEISWKHGVPIVTVVLRWLLQTGEMDTTSRRCVLLSSNLYKAAAQIADGRPWGRPRELRDVFRFQLDDEDMDRLWQLSGRSEIHQVLEEEDPFGLFEDEADNKRLDLDLNNRKLWL